MGWFLSIVCAVSLIAGPAAAEEKAGPGFKPKIVYGVDGRQEVAQVRSQGLKSIADSTIALFQARAVGEEKDDEGNLEIKTSPYDSMFVQTPDAPWGKSVPFCKDEPYKGQGAGAFCSGSLVGPDTIMTAGHCVRTQASCESTKSVFGFHADGKGTAPSKLPAKQIFGCSKLVAQKLEGGGEDYAIIKLDGTPEGRRPLRFRRHGKAPAGTPLVVIGHPAGLPAKVAGGAAVRDPDNGGFLVADLDTYGGNSGSAVFNAVTGEIEGILVRGGRDYIYDEKNKCARSNPVPTDGGRGEDVTLVSAVIEHLPKGGRTLNSVKTASMMDFNGWEGR